MALKEQRKNITKKPELKYSLKLGIHDENDGVVVGTVSNVPASVEENVEYKVAYIIKLSLVFNQKILKFHKLTIPTFASAVLYCETAHVTLLMTFPQIHVHNLMTWHDDVGSCPT